jgi:hypothetical protein
VTVKRNGRRHSVRGELNVRELSKAGSSLTLELFVRQKRSRAKIGELVIGRGALYWYGRNRHRRKRISWTRFAEMMDKLAYED